MIGLHRLAPGLLAAALWLLAGPAAAEEVHGEDAIFADRGLAVLWAFLRGAGEEVPQVVVRIVPLVRRYAFYSVDAVDPFTRSRRRLVAGDLSGPAEIRSSRATFAEFPRREIHLYGSADDLGHGRPVLTIFYLGIPDTTPELSSEGALAAYFRTALGRTKGRAPGPSP